MRGAKRNLNWLGHSVGVGLALAASVQVGRAQVPNLLVGKWAVRQISFVAQPPVADSVLHQMDNPQVASLNNAIRDGGSQLVVEFRPDGTYQFVQTIASRVERTEQGTYAAQGTTLYGQSLTTDGGSSFNNQQITRLTRRILLLTFLVGPNLPGVSEEVEYRRLAP